jgi:hypothetical protein
MGKTRLSKADNWNGDLHIVVIGRRFRMPDVSKVWMRRRFLVFCLL